MCVYEEQAMDETGVVKGPYPATEVHCEEKAGCRYQKKVISAERKAVCANALVRETGK